MNGGRMTQPVQEVGTACDAVAKHLRLIRAIRAWHGRGE